MQAVCSTNAAKVAGACMLAQGPARTPRARVRQAADTSPAPEGSRRGARSRGRSGLVIRSADSADSQDDASSDG